MILRWRKGHKGQSVVEMALAAPVLAILLVATADFARVFYASIEVANAARAGVQYGVQNFTTGVDFTGMQSAALNDGKNVSGLKAAASEFCQCSGKTVACSPVQCSQPQIFVQVQTTATFSTMLHYPGMASSIPLSSTAVMEVQ
jgi:Flp pilus assembly protein TadG